MSLAARRLPIVRSCPIPGELGGARRDGATLDCARCNEKVHDLGAMSERAVRSLLAGHVGRSMCVQYRVRGDGSIALDDARRAGLAIGCSALLSACTGHLEAAELDVPDDPVAIVGSRHVAERATIPDEMLPDDAEQPPDDAEQPPDDAHVERGDADGNDGGGADLERVDDAPIERGSDVPDASNATPAQMTMRADFAIDPEAAPLRGMIIVSDEWREPSGRLHFEPTKKLVAEWLARIRARRAGR